MVDDLTRLLRVLNREYDPEHKKSYPEIGYYYLLGSAHRVKLVRIINAQGGVEDVIPGIGYANKQRVLDGVRGLLAARERMSNG